MRAPEPLPAGTKILHFVFSKIDRTSSEIFITTPDPDVSIQRVVSYVIFRGEIKVTDLRNGICRHNNEIVTHKHIADLPNLATITVT